MKAILSGTTLKISAETEQEGQDLKVWLDKNIGREGDMEFDTEFKTNCGGCDHMTIEVNNEAYCGLISHFEDGRIMDKNSRLDNCPL